MVWGELDELYLRDCVEKTLWTPLQMNITKITSEITQSPIVLMNTR